MRDPEGQRVLLALANEALDRAVRGATATPPDSAALPAPLRVPGACFVTLTKEGALRGCIGSLEPQRPLWQDAMVNAAAAALRDPRFPPVVVDELALLALSISVLTPREPLIVPSREELLEALRPGVDGLVLIEGPRRATFLPKVWEQLPEPERFLGQLMIKAGLPARYWSPTVRFEKYRSVELPGGPGADLSSPNT